MIQNAKGNSKYRICSHFTSWLFGVVLPPHPFSSTSETTEKVGRPETQKQYLVPDQVSVVHVAILFRFVQYDCTSRRISHFSSSLESGALKSKTVCPLKSSNSSETNIFTLSKHLTESISVLHPCSRMCFCRGLLWRTGNAPRPRPPPSK